MVITHRLIFWGELGFIASHSAIQVPHPGSLHKSLRCAPHKVRKSHESDPESRETRRTRFDEQQSGPYLWEIYRFLAAHAQIGAISAQARPPTRRGAGRGQGRSSGSAGWRQAGVQRTQPGRAFSRDGLCPPPSPAPSALPIQGNPGHAPGYATMKRMSDCMVYTV
jgi:hypothetical protein